MAKLKLDQLLCGAEVAELLLLGLTALLDQVFQQQRVFTHPLDGLQQVGRQVHLVSELQLLILGTDNGAQVLLKVKENRTWKGLRRLLDQLQAEPLLVLSGNGQNRARKSSLHIELPKTKSVAVYKLLWGGAG
ncbi:hypothetical protein EYF80_011350 [Liparis tanakae]|uniref:Uncharacterized protein n=1 Tax=Liparis tanakae TaxID=230148 RepID=A0A4Z2IKF4_9TELE|nr:hypothetical protein EYF80_011350 [Liparis tanakae]